MAPLPLGLLGLCACPGLLSRDRASGDRQSSLHLTRQKGTWNGSLPKLTLVPAGPAESLTCEIDSEGLNEMGR